MPSNHRFALAVLIASLWLGSCNSAGHREPVVPGPIEASTEMSPETVTVPTKTASSGIESAMGEPSGSRQVTLLHINDVYRIAGADDGEEGGLARVRALRQELEKTAPDLLFMHAGDLLFPSMLSRQFDGAQMIDVLNLMDGDRHHFDDRMFAVFGNHEFDKGKAKYTSLVDLRVEESSFYWLGTNIRFQPDNGSNRGVQAWNLIDSKIVESGGVRVGIFGLSTDMVHPDYVVGFDDPTQVARRLVAELREQGAEVVVALTHLSMSEDIAVLEALGEDGPDLVLGGHEHNKQIRKVGDCWILKADAEARTASVVRVTVEKDGALEVDFEFPELTTDSPADEQVQEVVDTWLKVHDREFCFGKELPPGCLDDVFGHTNVRLIGEELTIRRYESNFGNWIVDRALEQFADRGAQVAFINSGSFRINQDIPAGSDVTRRHIEETFQYSSFLRRLRITGAVLQEAIEHSVENWTGEGKWLQISGFAFRHDPSTGTADQLTLLTADGGRPIEPDEELILVTGGYLVDTQRDQDGYTMLTEEMIIPDDDPPSLRDLVVAKLQAAGGVGISPQVEGRICNTQRPEPCLAVAGASE